jgi:hypothetical protein
LRRNPILPAQRIQPGKPMCGKCFPSCFLAAWLLFAGLCAANAAIVTNVAPVNVTPTSFSILCRSTYDISIAVFADASGTSNLTSQLSIESYPVHTGNPDLPAGYSRRQSQLFLRQKEQSSDFVLIRVTGCQPGATYYYQLSNSPTSVYPTSGPLPSVTTERENTFVIDDQQLILDIPGLDNMGRIVTLTHTNAAHPLAAVIGDGVGTNQVFFNLNDLFNLATGGNLAPADSQTFNVDVWGPGGADILAQFTVSFSLNFHTGQGNQVSVGTEYLALSIGSAVLQVGQSTNVPVKFNSSAGLASLDLTLNVAPGHLSTLSLTSLASEVDPVGVKVTVQSATNVVLHLPARSGQVISGTKEVAQLSFSATSGQQSAFVPLTLRQVVAARPDSTLMTNLTLVSGRLVIVGRESLLEASLPNGGAREMTLYAKPYLCYALEYSTNVRPGSVWTRLRPIAVTQLATPVFGLDGAFNQIFYRAVEFNADPPYLEANRNEDGSRYLTLFGKPGSGYVIESSGALGAPTIWSSVTNVPLGTPFTNIPVADQGMVFYRVGEIFGSPPAMNLVRNTDGSADITLFGRAGYAYLPRSAPPANPNLWATLQRIGLDKPFTTVHLTDLKTSLVSVLEYAPDPCVLELSPNGDGTAILRLFGKPGSSYRVENASLVGAGANWKSLFRVPLETSYANLQTVPLNQKSAFYRAVEFTADVPILEALMNPDRSRKLLLYGQKSQSYAVEYTTNFSSHPTWYPLVTNTFSSSFGYVNVTNSSSSIFYRLHRN